MGGGGDAGGSMLSSLLLLLKTTALASSHVGIGDNDVVLLLLGLGPVMHSNFCRQTFVSPQIPVVLGLFDSAVADHRGAAATSVCVVTESLLTSLSLLLKTSQTASVQAGSAVICFNLRCVAAVMLVVSLHLAKKCCASTLVPWCTMYWACASVLLCLLDHPVGFFFFIFCFIVFHPFRASNAFPADGGVGTSGIMFCRGVGTGV